MPTDWRDWRNSLREVVERIGRALPAVDLNTRLREDLTMDPRAVQPAPELDEAYASLDKHMRSIPAPSREVPHHTMRTHGRRRHRP